MREFIYEHDLRMTRENRINIHFFKNCAFVLDFPAGNGFHLLGKFFNTFASVGFDETDDYILATAAPPQSFTQHAEGLPDTRRIAEEKLKNSPCLFRR